MMLLRLWKRIRPLVPHLSIILCGLFVVLYVADRFNSNMNFIGNNLSKNLLLLFVHRHPDFRHRTGADQPPPAQIGKNREKSPPDGLRRAFLTEFKRDLRNPSACFSSRVIKWET